MLDRIRDYFELNDVLAVDTPALSTSAVSDPNIASLRVAGIADNSTPLFLHTSPEHFMKRLLAAGKK